MPVRVILTQGTAADCTQASKLIEGIDADQLIADRGYDTDAIIEQAAAQGTGVVIPPKKNRIVQRPYDEDLYKLRHLVENAFLHLKRQDVAAHVARTRKFWRAPLRTEGARRLRRPDS